MSAIEDSGSGGRAAAIATARMTTVSRHYFGGSASKHPHNDLLGGGCLAAAGALWSPGTQSKCLLLIQELVGTQRPWLLVCLKEHLGIQMLYMASVFHAVNSISEELSKHC